MTTRSYAAVCGLGTLLPIVIATACGTASSPHNNDPSGDASASSSTTLVHDAPAPLRKSNLAADEIVTLKAVTSWLASYSKAATRPLDLKGFVGLYADDVSLVSQGVTRRGKRTLEDVTQAVFNAFQTLKVEASRVFLQGDTAIVEWVKTGTAGTSKASWRGADVFVVNAPGLIIEEHLYEDGMSIPQLLEKPLAKPFVASRAPAIFHGRGNPERDLSVLAKEQWPFRPEGGGGEPADVNKRFDAVFGSLPAGAERKLYEECFPGGYFASFDEAKSGEQSWIAPNAFIAEFTLRATVGGTGNCEKFGKTGAGAIYHGLDVLEFDADTLVSRTTYRDSAELQRHLVTPAAASSSAKPTALPSVGAPAPPSGSASTTSAPKPPTAVATAKALPTGGAPKQPVTKPPPK